MHYCVVKTPYICPLWFVSYLVGISAVKPSPLINIPAFDQMGWLSKLPEDSDNSFIPIKKQNWLLMTGKVQTRKHGWPKFWQKKTFFSMSTSCFSSIRKLITNNYCETNQRVSNWQKLDKTHFSIGTSISIMVSYFTLFPVFF